MKLSSELLSAEENGIGAHKLEATNLEEGTILPEGTNPQEVAGVARGQRSAPRAVRPEGGERSQEIDKGAANGGTQPRSSRESPKGAEEADVVEAPSTTAPSRSSKA